MIKVPHHPADVSGVGTCTVHAIKRQNKSKSVKVSHCSVSFGHKGKQQLTVFKIRALFLSLTRKICTLGNMLITSLIRRQIKLSSFI